MRHYYCGAVVWLYPSALDPECLYDSAEEAYAADVETAAALIAEATELELRLALSVANPLLARAMNFLAGEMDELVSRSGGEPQP
jgi:hypothetical protein